MDTSTVLLTIQSILDNNPLYHEPNVSNKLYIDTYNKIISHQNIKTLFLLNTFDIPEEFTIFSDIIKENFLKNKDNIENIIDKNIKKKKLLNHMYIDLITKLIMII